MRNLLGQLGGKPLLLWIADAMPPAPTQKIDLFLNPMLIDAAMIDALTPYAGEVVYALPSQEARAMGLDGMVYEATELPIAASLPGPYVHREVCNALLPYIEAYFGGSTARRGK
jgi:hypothetical protein